MTLDNDKLVEEVARAICAVNKLIPDNYSIKRGVKIPQWRKFEKEARAVLAIIRPAVIEECARVAEDEAYGFPPDELTEHGTGYYRACKEIAAAIRALNKGGGDD